MQIQETIRLRGAFELILKNAENGEIVNHQKFENTVVTSGRAWVLKQINSVNIVTSQTISHIGIGSNTVAPSTANTALGAEVTRLAIASFVTTNLTAAVPWWQAQVTFATSDANTTLAEAAMFNSSAVGTMLARATFASFVKATSNTLAISYNLSN